MRHRLTIFFALLVSLSVLAQVPQQERQALQDLYNSTQGANWNQTWDLSQEIATLPGVTVTNGHVTEIRMLFNNLQGTLPTTLSDLTQLKVLELSFNKLKGTIPASITSIETLEILALNGNAIEGAIPMNIGSLSNLKQLHLSSNQLNGTLPTTLNELEQLEVFNVFDNQLNGDLPIALARNRNMREFIIAENNFQNTSEISSILMSNSAGIDLEANMLVPSAKSVIAIETSDDEN